MSLWTSSSSSTSSSSALLQALVLTVVVVTQLLMNSGCIAAGTGQHSRHPDGHSKNFSETPFQIQMDKFERIMHEAERNVAALKPSKKALQQNFNKYNDQTARHGWPTARKQHFEEESIRNKAQHLRTNLRKIKHDLRYFEPLVNRLRDPMERKKLARQGPTKQQMEQNVKLYEIIMNMIKNFLECPVQILDLLGSSDSEGDESAPETNGGEYGIDGPLYPEYY